jgi:hypothetical protein
MTIYKCTSINDIYSHFTNIPKSLITIKTIKPANTTTGDFPIWEVTIPYIISSQCPKDYVASNIITGKDSIICNLDISIPKNWTFIGYSNGRDVYSTPNGNITLPPSTTTGKAQLGYETLTIQGKCTDIANLTSANVEYAIKKFGVTKKDINLTRAGANVSNFTILSTVKNPITTTTTTSQPITRTSIPTIITTSQPITRASAPITTSIPSTVSSSIKILEFIQQYKYYILGLIVLIIIIFLILKK